jgi:hypothetical protein
VPIAASLALLIGLGAGVLLARTPWSQEPTALTLGEVAKGSALRDALETARSGVVRNGHLVVATFRDKRNRYCREIELISGTGNRPQAAGVACRSTQGAWIMEGAARLEIAGASEPSGGYTPSGAAEKDALSALLALLGAGTVMTTAEEGAALERGWR